MGERVNLLDIKIAVNSKLESEFENIKLYSAGTVEGFKRPSFFTSIIPLMQDHEHINYYTSKILVVINYFNKFKKDREIDNLKMHDKLLELFGLDINVGRRTLTLSNIKSEIVDEVLQFRFELDFKDYIEKEETEAEIAKELEIELNKE